MRANFQLHQGIANLNLQLETSPRDSGNEFLLKYNLGTTALVNLDDSNQNVKIDIIELIEQNVLGVGEFGSKSVVKKMQHAPSKTDFAVKVKRCKKTYS